MLPIRRTSRLIDGTRPYTHPSIISVHPTFTLKRLYTRTPLVSIIAVSLVWFSPLSGPCTNLLEHSEINDPKYIDLDATCFMMFTRDLHALFGIMARPANRKVPVRDLPEFDDWLHVILDPIVVRCMRGVMSIRGLHSRMS
jgi:hypothetical protein